MSADFAELDYRRTPLGELSLRRRRVRALDGLEVYEVKLGDAFLMSSLFHHVEVALADLGLAALGETPELDVVVGGLGLGYTARAALRHPAVRSLIVVETLEAVIEWHERGLVPLGPELTGDGRCRFVHGDFFARADAAGGGFDPARAGQKFHAVLLDIDHSPRHLLHARHGAFYEPAGLRGLAGQLRPGGGVRAVVRRPAGRAVPGGVARGVRGGRSARRPLFQPAARTRFRQHGVRGARTGLAA